MSKSSNTGGCIQNAPWLLVNHEFTEFDGSTCQLADLRAYGLFDIFLLYLHLHLTLLVFMTTKYTHSHLYPLKLHNPEELLSVSVKEVTTN